MMTTAAVAASSGIVTNRLAGPAATSHPPHAAAVPPIIPATSLAPGDIRAGGGSWRAGGTRPASGAVAAAARGRDSSIGRGRSSGATATVTASAGAGAAGEASRPSCADAARAAHHNASIVDRMNRIVMATPSRGRRSMRGSVDARVGSRSAMPDRPSPHGEMHAECGADAGANGQPDHSSNEWIAFTRSS